MTESSQRMTPEPPATPNEFPNGNAKDGVAYQMANPANPLQQLVVLSMESYVKLGTDLQGLRQIAQKQDKRIKELVGENSVIHQMLVDTRTRLENLRAVRKTEKRPEIEAQFGVPVGSTLPTAGE